MKTYTVKERANVIYNTVVDIFNWNRVSDCVTPLDLVRKQFEGVSPQGKICIPGAGIGTYVLVALEKGFLPENITAVEIDPMYYELGSGMFKLPFGVNYVHTDFLTWEPNMKFDVVIGNPPYSLPKGQKAVSDGTKNLSLKFIEKANSLLKPDGYISMLTPLNFLKPTDREKPTRSFSVFEGLKLSFIETGVQRSWFPGIGTSIALWGAVKTVKNCKMTLNGVDWDLSQTPFIVDLDIDQLLVFKKVWGKLNSKEEVVVCRRVKDGNELPPEGWSLTERVNRRLGKKFVVPWGDLPVREKYEQIHISLDPEKAQRLFSQSHVRFFVKATNIEPTLYHNLLNGLSFNSQNFSTQELQVIENYLGCG